MLKIGFAHLARVLAEQPGERGRGVAAAARAMARATEETALERIGMSIPLIENRP